jgi:predicted RNA-binding Zn ribbon-like protein
METRELPIVAGHLALDFANTVDDPGGKARHDHLGTYPELVRWAARMGIAVAEEPGILERAHELRDVLNAVFGAVARDEPIPWETLRPFAVESLAHARLSPTYTLTWPDEPMALLWQVAGAAADLLTGPDVHRVKQCDGCPWVFLDHSKNGSRRWCAMDDCGKHAKIQRYVAKRAARRRAT